MVLPVDNFDELELCIGGGNGSMAMVENGGHASRQDGLHPVET